MEEKLTAKMVDELLPTEKGKLIDQLYRAKKKTVVEEELGISIRNGSRYRRLIRLIPQFGKMVDEEEMPLLSGVALSFLNKEEQNLVFQTMSSFKVYMSPELANEIRKRQGNLTLSALEEIMIREACEGIPAEGIRLDLPREMCGRYFRGMCQREMTRKIDQAMRAWYMNNAVSERLQLFDRLLHRGLDALYMVEVAQ